MAIVQIILKPGDSITICYHEAEVHLRTAKSVIPPSEHDTQHWIELTVKDDRNTSKTALIHAATTAEKLHKEKEVPKAKPKKHNYGRANT